MFGSIFKLFKWNKFKLDDSLYHSTTTKKEEFIKDFQKEHGIEETGKVDDSTFRRLETEKETEKELKNYIICNGDRVPINWNNVVTLDSDNALVLKSGYKKFYKKREPKYIVTHWDVALSSESCFNILKKRGISTHFSIDNDGTIYQFVDTNHAAWHAGPTSADKKWWREKHKVYLKNSWNNESIGIDFSNAYYKKYNKVYQKRGFGLRPVINSVVHNIQLEHLGYYPIQVAAYEALLDSLCSYYYIPFEHPPMGGVDKDTALGKFKGICCHYHLTARKIDCAGLNLPTIIKNLRK